MEGSTEHSCPESQGGGPDRSGRERGAGAWAGLSVVRPSYNGSTLTFQLLRASGWATLLNLGFFRIWDWLLHPFRVDLAQERLVRKSISLLGVSPGDRILD